MKKRILYVLPYPNFFSQHSGVGGHVAHAAGIVHGFVDSGHEVTVVSEESHQIFNHRGVDQKVCPCSSSSPIARQLWALKLLKFIGQQVSSQEYDLCYIRYSASFAPWIPKLKSILGETKLILEVNSLGSQWRGFLTPLDRRALLSVDRVICVSKILENNISEILSGSEERPDIRVVVNGVNSDRFEIPAKSLGDASQCHIGFAGLLKSDYGIETLIDAAQLLINDRAVIHIFGDGPYRGVLEEYGQDIPNVIFHGPVEFVDMPGYLKGLDILVYTTGARYLYQSPTKLFEYMAAEKAIVCAKTPQTEDLLRNKKHALFFEVNNPVSLADSIKELLDNQSLQENLGQAAKAEVAAKHSWKQKVTEILSEK